MVHGNLVSLQMFYSVSQVVRTAMGRQHKAQCASLQAPDESTFPACCVRMIKTYDVCLGSALRPE
jgi:hypothetical protein